MIDLEKEREAFEEMAHKMGMCLDQYWGDGYDNPYENEDTYLAYNIFREGAKSKKSEIKELKQKLEKIESGEFVLVPRDKIEILWQDDDEPENFVNKESDFDCLGDCIDLNEIMTINAHHQANLKTEKMYGTWFAEVGYPKEKANFHVGTHQECLDIIAKNKAMIEAVEKDS